MSSFARPKAIAGISLVFGLALAESACQTATIVPGFTPGTPAGDTVAAISIKQPTVQPVAPGSSSVTFQWTYSGIAAPQWKLMLNIGNGGFTDQTGNFQCNQSPCSASMTLGPGAYELLIEDQTTGVGNKVAFNIDN